MVAFNYLERKDGYFMVKDDRTNRYHAYTVFKEDDSRKINIRITDPLAIEVDKDLDDLAKLLFRNAVEFLEQRKGPWKIELTIKNSLDNKNFSPPEFGKLATENKEIF